jgi:hypothetical protein
LVLTKHSESAEISGRNRNLILSPVTRSSDSFLQANTQIMQGIPPIIYPGIAKYDHAAARRVSRALQIFISVLERETVPHVCVVSHHRVQVVSTSVKCFLMKEECLFARSLQNILHERKLPEYFFYPKSLVLCTRTIKRRMEDLRITLSVLGTGKC